jgi:hypothetical protein
LRDNVLRCRSLAMIARGSSSPRRTRAPRQRRNDPVLGRGRAVAVEL